MTDKPTFDARRSAAIRELLIENVEAEPRRRDRRLRALLGGLVITGIVTSGTAALALNRDAIFTAPAPTATSSNTAPPTSGAPQATPTFTPATSDRATLATSPIEPHDVMTAPTGAGWSIQLPGMEDVCRWTEFYNISDGLSLVVIGPEIPPEDLPHAPCDLTENVMSLTLVDTHAGEIMWSRDWTWTPGPNEQGLPVQTNVLGASGRILVDSYRESEGPSEVLDLATGDSIAAFEPSTSTEIATSINPIPDGSGDVYATFEELSADGGTLPFSTVKRLDPANATEPIWSTRLDSTDVHASSVQNTLRYTLLTSWVEGAAGVASYGVLNLATGEYSPRPQPFLYDFFTGVTVRSQQADPSAMTHSYTALDDEGNPLWERTEPSGSQLKEVVTAAATPGKNSLDQTGNGQLVLLSRDAAELIDGDTGATMWKTATTDCGFTSNGTGGDAARESADDGSITILQYGDTIRSCRVDASRAVPVENASFSVQARYDYGTSSRYQLVDGQFSAVDLATGGTVWAIDSAANGVLFAGGYLVTKEGATLRSVG